MQTSRKISAEIMVSIAFILLVAYISDAGIALLNHGQGFLPLSAKDRGMIFGGISILLFFVSYGVGFNISSRILTILLIVGGALMGTSVLVSSFMPNNSNLPSNTSTMTSTHQTISPQFIGIIVIGYIIMGLGILRSLRKK
jgi:hypothetical protein